MERSDVLRTIGLVKALWPGWQAPTSKPDLAALADVWGALLADIDVDLVVAGVQSIAAEGGEFPPPVGRIRARSIELLDRARGVWPPTPEQAWDEVQRVIGRVGREGRPVWTHHLIESAVGAVGWVVMCNSTDLTGTRITFTRTFAALAATERLERNMPPAVAAAIDALRRHELTAG